MRSLPRSPPPKFPLTQQQLVDRPVTLFNADLNGDAREDVVTLLDYTTIPAAVLLNTAEEGLPDPVYPVYLQTQVYKSGSFQDVPDRPRRF